jgi:hypothetical protein
MDIGILSTRVFTGDPARPWAEALAIRDDRVLTAGSTAGRWYRTPFMGQPLDSAGGPFQLLTRDALQVRSGGAVEGNRKLMKVFGREVQRKLAEVWARGRKIAHRSGQGKVTT